MAVILVGRGACVRIGDPHQRHRCEPGAPHAGHQRVAIGTLRRDAGEVPHSQAGEPAEQQGEPDSRERHLPGDQRHPDRRPQRVPAPPHGAVAGAGPGERQERGEHRDVAGQRQGLLLVLRHRHRGEQLGAAECRQRPVAEQRQRQAGGRGGTRLEEQAALAADREVDQHGQRHQHGDEGYECVDGHEEDPAQHGGKALDILGDAARRVVREGCQHDDEHRPEQRDDQAQQVGLVVHPGRRDVDDLDRRPVRRPAGRRPLPRRGHAGESRQRGLSGRPNGLFGGRRGRRRVRSGRARRARHGGSGRIRRRPPCP